MPAMTRMPLHIDMKKYTRLPGVVRADFDGWLKAEHLVDKNVIELTVGEGAVTVEHYVRGDEGKYIVDLDETGEKIVRTETKVFPVKSLPPKEAFK